MQIAGGVLYFVIWLGLAIFQLAAFVEGLDFWLGLNAFWSTLAFVLAIMIPSLGSIAIAVVGFVGATEGWRWEWWQAALLCFPFVIMSFFVMGIGGATQLLWQLWPHESGSLQPERPARPYDLSDNISGEAGAAAAEDGTEGPQTSGIEAVNGGSNEPPTTGPKSDLAAANERIAQLEGELYQLMSDRDERIKELDQTSSQLENWRRQAESSQQRLRKKMRAERVDFAVLLIVMLIFFAVLIF